MVKRTGDYDLNAEVKSLNIPCLSGNRMEQVLNDL